MSNYKREFPAYDGLLPTLNGWKDTSWHNDACPSTSRIISDEFGTIEVRLWCDWANKEERDPPGTPRFTLYVQFVDPADNYEPGTNEANLQLRGETMEDLRAAAIKWYLDNVGDSILEEDLTTAKILEETSTMWAFNNMRDAEAAAAHKQRLILNKHESETGGGCKAYIFEHASNFIWVTGDDGITLPTDEVGERKLLCIRDQEGNESGCIEVVAPMSNLLEFLKGIGADVF